ncbi:MAG: D-alanine--D-alanine ligase A [Flavobacteriales bacterium]|nr:D-alanine--D-alanine ligase A [Flavobacteriales bacterium]|tara:strand:+ start:13800 stop:14720 length:921 start_codon:yes stop_codon:yes gene_type:complete
MEKVVIITGGYSSEHNISLQSAQTVEIELKNLGYSVSILKIEKSAFDYRSIKTAMFDCAFIALHGPPAEDGDIQKYLDKIKLPYTCSGSNISSITFNKYECNLMLKKLGLRCPKSISVSDESNIDYQSVEKEFSYPLIVKPNRSGSSYGVSKVINMMQLKVAIKLAFEHDNHIMFEEFIDGTEVSCGVYYNNAVTSLPVTEIVTDNEFFDYEAKYEGKSNEITPARINQKIYSKIKNLTEKIYSELNLKGICRVDYIIKNNLPYIIEINTVPGLSNESIIPKQLKGMNISLSEIFKISIENATFNE